MCCEVQIGTSEQARFNVAGLGTALDQAGRFEIIETAIERAHGLHGATGEQLTSGKDGTERFRGVDRAGEGGEYGTSALRKLLNMRSAECGAKDDPRQVYRVTVKGGEGV